MEDSFRDPESNITSIPSSDKSQLSSLHQGGGSYIIRLNNSTQDHANQIYPSYITQPIIDNPGKDEPGNEIAFEIIQEPLLNDNDNRVIIENNTLFFETEDSFDKTHYQNKDQQKPFLNANNSNNKGEVVAIRANKKQEDSFLNSPVKEELPVSDNSKPDIIIPLSSATSTTSPSSSSQTFSVFNNSLKTESQWANEGKIKDSDVIKKTVVEAFVKMVVCRKITVQKRDARTNDILDIDVKLEEDEPVVLDVDYVETTEDIISGHVAKNSSGSDSFKPTSLSTSSTGDGSIDILKVMPDESGKISKSILNSSILQSTLQKGISRVLHMDKNLIANTKNNDKSKEYSTEDIDMDSFNNNELVERVKDNTTDIDIDSNQKLTMKFKQSEIKPEKIAADHEFSEKADEESKPCSSDSHPLPIRKDTVEISIPKKRGRKRKWDRAIGLAPNLKICQFCFKSFDSVNSCRKHMKKGNCVSSQFCFLCSKTFDSEEQLERHIKSHRDENRNSSFDCSDCRRSYRTKAGFMKHFKMGTCQKREDFEDGETGDYSCELCDSRFSSLDYLHLHQYKVHENPKDRHICADCGKTFYSLHGYQRHRSGRPCTEPLKCYICGKTYKSKESFKLHMKHHKSEITGITYNCDECGRSYMTETALTKHKLLHTGVKPYKCDVCGKEFAMRYQVKDHARMHTGEKPYSCELCGVAFSNKGHLGRHIRSHENGTLFRRGRPKKSQEPFTNNSGETEIKLSLIELGPSLPTVDGQTIQVVDGQIFKSQDGPPMIIQADTNTIIIAEGWQDNSTISTSQSQATVVRNSSTAS